MAVELREKLSERICFPAVQEAFDFYVSCGCFDQTQALLEQLPEPASRVMTSVLATQVHKEKAIWPVLVARGMGFDLGVAVRLGAAADFLWALSTVIDDMYDNDFIRAGDPSVWMRLGKEGAGQIAFGGLRASLAYLQDEVGELTRVLAEGYVLRGIDSIAVHRRMGLDTDPSLILDNYLARNDFHTAFPVVALAMVGGQPKAAAERMTLGFQLFNQAGQIINDYKDFLVGENGLARLSDLRGGRVSIVLQCLYGSLSRADRKRLSEFFGANTLSLEENQMVVGFAGSRQFIDQTRRRIEDTYRRGIKMTSEYIDEEGIVFMKRWRDYKTAFLAESLGGDF